MIDELQASRTATFFVLSHPPSDADVDAMADAMLDNVALKDLLGKKW